MFTIDPVIHLHENSFCERNFDHIINYTKKNTENLYKRSFFQNDILFYGTRSYTQSVDSVIAIWK